jgi:hypothetical protein
MDKNKDKELGYFILRNKSDPSLERDREIA